MFKRLLLIFILFSSAAQADRQVTDQLNRQVTLPDTITRAVVLQHQMPEVEVLTGGLEILRTTDLREALSACSLPFLRIYGYLDGLVPRKVALLLDSAWPRTQSVVMKGAAHAPFVSHPDDFSNLILEFAQQHQC